MEVVVLQDAAIEWRAVPGDPAPSFQDISIAELMQAMMVVASICNPRSPPYTGLDTGVTMPALADQPPLAATTGWRPVGFVDHGVGADDTLDQEDVASTGGQTGAELPPCSCRP